MAFTGRAVLAPTRGNFEGCLEIRGRSDSQDGTSAV
jgi:hypothetical protein